MASRPSGAKRGTTIEAALEDADAVAEAENAERGEGATGKNGPAVLPNPRFGRCVRFVPSARTTVRLRAINRSSFRENRFQNIVAWRRQRRTGSRRPPSLREAWTRGTLRSLPRR